MIHLDERFERAVETAVDELEATTDAEIVVVAAARSGGYRDVAITGGVVAAAALLLLAVFSPWHFSDRWLTVDMALAVMGVSWLTHRWPWWLRTFTTPGRRRRQVEEAAAATFFQEQVHATRGRTGILIYVSALEDDVTVLADHGVAARVPQALWHDLRWDARRLDGFLEGLKAAGALLAEHLPAKPGDNPDEIPNKPRVRK